MKQIIIISLLLFTGLKKIHSQDNGKISEILGAVKLPGVTITAVQEISNGIFKMPGTDSVIYIPAIIRVAFTSKPTADSYIRSEIWLPKDNWNGRFLGTGNGGGAGGINYGPLISGVRRGFATANTDMGTSPGVNAAIGHPEKWADFGYRATHEMTTGSKAILRMYYNKQALYSYFVGCSTGGQQALMEAQRYPEDYNGIIAGAPANNRTHLHASFIWNTKATNGGGMEKIISPQKIALFARLTIEKCGGKDGGAPGDDYLTDPMRCAFNPDILPHCQNEAAGDSCFSTAEIDALKKIYSGPVNPRTGERIYPPHPLGGFKLDETSVHFYPFKWVFGAGFDYTKFDFDHDITKVDSILGPLLNANDPDLSELKKRGGKILMFTGTADQLVPYPEAVKYYESVIKAQHGLKPTQEFFRYFVVPGMGHCGNGPAASDFGQRLGLAVRQDASHDILTALVNWVERATAPDSIISTSFNCCVITDGTHPQRPIYPYPKFPAYIGGDTNIPSSYRGINRP